MTKSKIILMNFVMLFASIFFTSCNKDEKMIQIENQQNSSNRTIVNPINMNGTLKFNSENEYFTYLEFLDKELQQKTLDEVVSNLQSTFNFTSRYALDSNSDKSDHSDSEGLLLNTNYEFIVGDYLYVNKSPLESYRVKVNDAVGRSILQNMPYKGSLQPGQFGNRIEYVGPDKEVAFTGNGDCGCEIVITKSKSNGATLVSLAISCPQSALPLLGGTMNINWGDNISENVSIGFNSPIFITHVYTTSTSPDQNYKPGPYDLTISIPLNCGTGLTTQTITRKISLNDICCRKDFATKEVLISGITKIEYKYTLFTTFFARNAKTELWAYKLDQNGKFVKFNAQLKTGIDMVWRDKDNCAAEFENDEDGCSNCHYVVERLSGDKSQNKNITGEAIWKYSLVGNNTTILKDVSPNFCE